jgi:hypothetical protein
MRLSKPREAILLVDDDPEVLAVSRVPFLLVLLGPAAPLEPVHDTVPVIVERHGEGSDDDRQHDHFDVVAGGRLRALRGEHPGAGNAAECRHHREDPEGHGAEGEEIADDVLGQAGNQVDDEAENGTFRFHDEPELVPGFFAHEIPHVGVAQPAPEAEGGKRADGQRRWWSR